MTKENGLPPAPTKWPNRFCDEDYPLNFVFTEETHNGDGSTVGYCNVECWGGNEKKGSIHYLLVWDSGSVISITNNRYKERYKNGEIS